MTPSTLYVLSNMRLFAAYWLVMCIYYCFIIPVPIQPRYPIVASIPFHAILAYCGVVFVGIDPSPYIVPIFILWSLANLLGCVLWHSGRNRPGPFLAKFTRLWKLWHMCRGTFNSALQDAHKRYGPIVRIAPNLFSIDDPDSIKVVLGNKAKFDKSLQYYPGGDPDPRLAGIFAELDAARHAEKRRKLTPAYSMSFVIKMEQEVDALARKLENRFTSFAESAKTFDLSHWFVCFAIDGISQITTGVPLGYLENGEDVNGILASAREYLRVYNITSTIPEIYRPLFQFFSLIGGDKSGVAYLKTYTMDLIQAKLDGNQDKATLASDSSKGQDQLTWFAVHNLENPDKFSAADMYVHASSNYVAGWDTTAATLSASIYFLLQNPRTLIKLRAEIDEADRCGKLSDPITYGEAQQLPYLQACLKEALRMFPSSGLPMERVIPAGGATIAGTRFQEGAVIFFQAWVSNFNASVYDDPYTFRPERWIESPHEKLTEMAGSFLSFGYGAHLCIGRHIANLEIHKLVPQLIRKFDFELRLPDGRTEWTVWMDSLLRPLDFFVGVKLRESIGSGTQSSSGGMPVRRSL